MYNSTTQSQKNQKQPAYLSFLWTTFALSCVTQLKILTPTRTWPKCTVIGLLSSLNLVSFFSTNGEGAGLGRDCSGAAEHPFSATSCVEEKVTSMAKSILD